MTIENPSVSDLAMESIRELTRSLPMAPVSSNGSARLADYEALSLLASASAAAQSLPNIAELLDRANQLVRGLFVISGMPDVALEEQSSEVDSMRQAAAELLKHLIDADSTLTDIVEMLDEVQSVSRQHVHSGGGSPSAEVFQNGEILKRAEAAKDAVSFALDVIKRHVGQE